MSASRSSLGASSSVADFWNSTTLAGASTELAEMLGEADFSDGDLYDLAVDSFDQMAMEQRRLNLRDKVSELTEPSQARLPTMPMWICNPHTARIIQAAALCSKAVYRKKTPNTPKIPGFVLEARSWIQPTMDGSGKAAALLVMQPTESRGKTTLFFSVRGSACRADWLRNLDQGLVPCPDLVNLPDSVPEVHRGFVGCARTLVPHAARELETAFRETELQGRDIEIVFTGHSAGGAVAALLFCKFLTHGCLDTHRTKPTLSCITFGAPPMLDRTIDLSLSRAFSTSTTFQPGVTLAIVNDGDPVARLDRAYAALLLAVWHRVGGGGSCAGELRGRGLPPLSLRGMGERVVLFDAEQDFDGGQDDEAESERLMASRLDHLGLERRAWANVWAHKMDQYVEWTALVGDGRYNKAEGSIEAF
ncbi:hypothetical protein PspLS_03926 [Pyricularia sp. CBS 133598]|nr:hypothetical protein PspLS_03926 [Pyricularia sp. CBS 133598]